MTPLTPEIASDQRARVSRRLRILRYLALLDAILLIALVLSALTGTRLLVHILGPLHGVNFLILLVTAGTAALDGLWGWWFPTLILVTAGPIGTFIGDRAIARRAAVLTPERAGAAPADVSRASRAFGAGERGHE